MELLLQDVIVQSDYQNTNSE